MCAPKMISTALASVAFLAAPALAHTSVQTAGIDTLPDDFSFSFSQPVGLNAFSIPTQVGEKLARGPEPPLPCGYYDLNVARLPIPPSGHSIGTRGITVRSQKRQRQNCSDLTLFQQTWGSHQSDLSPE